MPEPPDLSALVGLPWEAGGRGPSSVDCWGLIVIAYRAALGVELPSWDTVLATDSAAVAAAAAEEGSRWLKAPLGQERPLDVMLIQQGRHASHVGLIVRRGRLLHVERGGTSHVARYGPDGAPFKVAGVYRLLP